MSDTSDLRDLLDGLTRDQLARLAARLLRDWTGDRATLARYRAEAVRADLMDRADAAWHLHQAAHQRANQELEAHYTGIRGAFYRYCAEARAACEHADQWRRLSEQALAEWDAP